MPIGIEHKVSVRANEIDWEEKRNGTRETEEKRIFEWVKEKEINTAVVNVTSKWLVLSFSVASERHNMVLWMPADFHSIHDSLELYPPFFRLPCSYISSHHSTMDLLAQNNLHSLAILVYLFFLFVIVASCILSFSSLLFSRFVFVACSACVPKNPPTKTNKPRTFLRSLFRIYSNCKCSIDFGRLIKGLNKMEAHIIYELLFFEFFWIFVLFWFLLLFSFAHIFLVLVCCGLFATRLCWLWNVNYSIFKVK